MRRVQVAVRGRRPRYVGGDGRVVAQLAPDVQSEESPPPTTRQRIGFGGALAIVVFASLVWNVAYTLITKWGDGNLVDEGDAFYYSLTGANASIGNWFRDAFTGAPQAEHGPLTTIVAMPGWWLFENVMAQRLTMSLLGALAVGAVGLLGRKVAGPTVGLVAAVLALVNANLFVNNALVMSEALTALLFTLLLLAGYRLVEAPSMGRAAVAGALCGLTALTRAESALFLPLMIVPILVLAKDLDWWARLARMAVAAICLVAVIAPWSLWVRTQFEEPVLVSTNDGLTLAGANCDTTYYTDRIGFWTPDCATPLMDPALDPSQNSVRLRREAFSYAREHIGRLPLVVVAREGRTFGFWRPDQVVDAGINEGRPTAISWLGLVTFWILAPIAVVGAVQLRRRGVTLIPFIATLISTVIVSAALNGIFRHRLGVDIATCVLAATAFVAWFRPTRIAPALTT
jgi:4-amino-4-deoxy-L-arabinose transferase-like glycosyltransferase